MTEFAYIVRYFQVVPPSSPLMIVSFAVLTTISVVLTALGDGTSAGSIVPVMVFQAFSVSTGFSVPARRGYFDLLIARGQPPARIAVVQWLAAGIPGVCSWTAVAAVQSAFHAGRNPLLFPGTLMALVLVSTVPWAVNVALPRFAGAIGWLLLICLTGTGGVIWPDSVREVVYPLDVLSGQQHQPPAAVVLAAVLLSISAMAAALGWVHRADIRLEAAQ